MLFNERLQVNGDAADEGLEIVVEIACTEEQIAVVVVDVRAKIVAAGEDVDTRKDVHGRVRDHVGVRAALVVKRVQNRRECDQIS